MVWRTAAAAGLLFLATSSLHAGDVPNSRTLVKQLGSAKYTERDAASKALDKLGAAALPDLMDASRQGDFETRRRASLLYQKIQDRLLAAEVMKPRLVRWQFKDQPLDRVLREINASSDLSLSCDPANGKDKVTIDTGAMPLWQAMDTFGRKTGYTELRDVPAARIEDGTGSTIVINSLRPYRALPGLRLAKAKRTDDPVDYQGPLRFRALPTSLHAVPLDDELQKKVWFLLEIRVDPVVPVLALDAVTVHSILDERGRPRKTPLGIPAPGPDQRDVVSGSGVFVVPIGPASENVSSWSEVKGTVTAHVRVQQPFVEVKDLANSVGKSFAGPYAFALKVLDAEVQDDGDVQVRLRATNLQAFHEAAAQPEVVRVRPGFVALRGPADIAGDHTSIYEARGRSLVRRSLASKPLPANPDGIELTLTYQGPVQSLAELRLVVAVPRSVRVNVPFTLRNKSAP
jgi:hypothetical protein